MLVHRTWGRLRPKSERPHSKDEDVAADRSTHRLSRGGHAYDRTVEYVCDTTTLLTHISFPALSSSNSSVLAGSRTWDSPAVCIKAPPPFLNLHCVARAVLLEQQRVGGQTHMGAVGGQAGHQAGRQLAEGLGRREKRRNEGQGGGRTHAPPAAAGRRPAAPPQPPAPTHNTRATPVLIHTRTSSCCRKAASSSTSSPLRAPCGTRSTLMQQAHSTACSARPTSGCREGETGCVVGVTARPAERAPPPA